jgi:hypothetical protein
MPFSYTIDPAANLIRETWTGLVTVEDLRQISIEELKQDDSNCVGAIHCSDLEWTG